MSGESSSCGACGARIDQPEDVSSEERMPCPACGSTSRRYARMIVEHLETHVTVRNKAKRQGKGRPFPETVFGAVFDRARGRWLHIEQAVDREKKRYRKKLVDPVTGEVFRDDDVPLDGHQGFGSAKRPER